MSIGRTGFGPLRVLLSLSLLLGAVLAWLWFDETGRARDIVWAPPKSLGPDIKLPLDIASGGTFGANPSTYAAILERPVFAPDRRPPPPPAPPPPPDPLANVQIHGIFSGASAGILARVDGKVRRVKVSETIGPWTLKSIVGREVTFSQGSENRQLRLTYAQIGAPAPQAMVPPSPGAHAAQVPAPVQTINTVTLSQKVQDEVRERLQRRNALRTSRGLPPLTE